MNQEYLQSVLNYDELTGLFTWKINSAKTKENAVAGGFTPNGYHRIRINTKRYLSHRLAWLYVYGYFPEKFIDHINGNPSDNRIKNLRLATNTENCCNAKLYKNNISGIKGVNWHNKKRKWRAYIKDNGKLKHLGMFDDFFEACCVACSYRNKLHKEFSRII